MSNKTRAKQHQETIDAWKKRGGLVLENPRNGVVNLYALGADSTLQYRGGWSPPPKEDFNDPGFEKVINALWKKHLIQRANLKVH